MSYKHVIKNKGNIKKENNNIKVIKANKKSSNKCSFLIEPKKPQIQTTIPELFKKK